MELPKTYTVSPPPPPSSPPSPPSHPRVQVVKDITSVRLAGPVRQLMPELNPGYIDYLLPKTPDIYLEISPNKVKALLLNPLLTPEVYKNPIMCTNWEVMIPHIPQFQVASHLPPTMKIFMELFLKKEVVEEMDERNLMMNFGLLLDATPLFPMVRKVVLLNQMPIRVQWLSNTDTLVIVQLHRLMKKHGNFSILV